MLIYEANGVFVLETKNTHYVMAVDKEGILTHLHWGDKCAIEDYSSLYTGNENCSNHSPRDISKTEYIPYGGIVYRPPAFMATYPDGCRESLLTYKNFSISKTTNAFLLEIFLVLNIKMPGFSVKIFAVCVAEEKKFFRRNKADYRIFRMWTFCMDKFAKNSAKVNIHRSFKNCIRQSNFYFISQ